MPSSTTSISAKRRWLSSERIAQDVLEVLGLRVVETRKKVILNNTQVGEVDAIAVDENGTVYAVEIKAGKVDVTGIRQAYVNAILLNAKPAVVCKGFADDATKELADKLGVRVIQLSDVFLVESEELNIIVRDVIEETLTDYLEIFYGFNPNIKSSHIEILSAISSSSSVEEAAEKLGIDVPLLLKKIDELRRDGVIPKWAKKYSSVKRVSQLIIQRQNVISALEESKKLVETLKGVHEQLRQLQPLIASFSNQVQRLSSHISKIESVLENVYGRNEKQYEQQSS